MRQPLLTVLKEPPLRRIVKPLVRALPFAPAVKSLWDAVEYPQYLVGVLHAAQYGPVSVIEFGVAAGHGLLALQRHARAVECVTQSPIYVYGFDTGSGLPPGTDDYRDHPDCWCPGDFPMDETALRSRLGPRSALILGDVAETALSQTFEAPVGFVAIDLDLYSSTVAALAIFHRTDVQRLVRTALYFDEVTMECNHRFAGELLAIEEFNAKSDTVKIDRWRGLRHERPFPEAPWLDGMYLAHDVEAISRARATRESQGPARTR
jgi:hypothetical protein